MLLLSLLTLSLPVLSAPKEATVTVCTGTLTSEAGTHNLQAWGADPGQAREALEDEATLLAELVRAGPRWADLYPLDGLSVALLSDGAKPPASAPLYVPGASLGEVNCSATAIGPALKRSESAWTARWGAGEADAITRVNPAHAISAARRRACIKPFQNSVMMLSHKLAVTAWEGRRALTEAGWAKASDGLMACWTSQVGEIKPASMPVSTSAPGLYNCTATRLGDMDPPRTLGQGWGATLEDAAAQAERTLPLFRYRAGFADGLDVHLKAHEQQRAALVFARLMQAVTGLSQPTDALDRAELSCRSATLSAPALVAWVPQMTSMFQGCGRDKAPAPLSVASLAELPGALDKTCEWSPNRVISQFGELYADMKTPEEQQRMVVMHQQTATACEVACRSEVVLDVKWTSLTLPGVPDRSSPEATWALIEGAIEARDADRLLMGIRDERLALSILKGDADTWAGFEAAKASGELRQMFKVAEYGGVFLATSAGR